MWLNGPSQHARSQRHPGKASSQEQGGYLLRVHIGARGQLLAWAAAGTESRASGLDAHFREQRYLFPETTCLPAAGCLAVNVMKVNPDGGSCW